MKSGRLRTMIDKATGRFVPTLTMGAVFDALLGGLSRAEFSRRTGVPGESLCRWAKGGRARAGAIAHIAIGLGGDPGEVEALLRRLGADEGDESP